MTFLRCCSAGPGRIRQRAGLSWNCSLCICQLSNVTSSPGLESHSSQQTLAHANMKKTGFQRAHLCPNNTQPGLEMMELREPGHESIQGWACPTPNPSKLYATECTLLCADLHHRAAGTSIPAALGAPWSLTPPT